ncbi:ankyrin repeat-containing domain protein [Linnemannia elongata]|nr:ankyrin repeat-containing domain protein [Linnemannia elongata]KAK5823402.1 ankyrin repeat-containing domain protein [Linnemannia elongata]
MSHNIWLAASDGDLAAVKAFINEKGVSINAQDEFGYSALHAAASYGHKELITYLLENGADVNIQDPEGDSPLFVCETVDIAEMLVKAGADAKHINENEMTAAENAEEEEWLEVAHYLRELTGVPHPDEVAELEDDMSHLMDEKDSDDSSDDEDKKANGESSTAFKERIEAIMKASEADGVDRDDELKAVVAEMLAIAGPDAAAALSEQLQALEKK